MKKYHWILKNPIDGEESTKPIDLGTVANLLLSNRIMLPQYFITYLHVVMGVPYAKKGDKYLYYSYDEAVKILESLGVNVELHVKEESKLIEDRMEKKLKCANCGHIQTWHHSNKKCCDGGCDCESFSCEIK